MSSTGNLTEVPGYAPQEVDEAMTWVVFDRETGLLYAVHEVSEYDNGEVAYSDTGAVSRWRLAEDGLTFERMEVGVFCLLPKVMRGRRTMFRGGGRIVLGH